VRRSSACAWRAAGSAGEHVNGPTTKSGSWLRTRLVLLALCVVGGAALFPGLRWLQVLEEFPHAESLVCLMPVAAVLPAVAAISTVSRYRKQDAVLVRPTHRSSPFFGDGPLAFLHFGAHAMLAAAAGVAVTFWVGGVRQILVAALVLLCAASQYVGVRISVRLYVRDDPT
jgi:hypothetical protein